MAETYTTNKSFAMVTPGTDPGTWGPFVNLNPALLDNMLGGTATIAVLNAPVILSSAQYQCAFLRFTGAITADISVTFPAVGSFYTIINDTTNSSNFCLTASTTAAGGRTIGIPPGSATEIMTDGVNARLRGLPHVGAYWDYAGSSVPRWVNSCTIPPYLNCDGTAFSSVTYPNLANALQGTTLPDLRGRLRATLNQTTGRITAVGGGVDGDTITAAGGVQSITLSSQHLPNIAFPVTDPGHTHDVRYSKVAAQGGAGVTPANDVIAGGGNLGAAAALSNTTGITVNSGGSGLALQPLPPMAIGGITMVRAA